MKDVSAKILGVSIKNRYMERSYSGVYYWQNLYGPLIIIPIFNYNIILGLFCALVFYGAILIFLVALRKQDIYINTQT